MKPRARYSFRPNYKFIWSNIASVMFEMVDRVGYLAF